MNQLRHKIVVALFFCLVSIGQAYPFASAYALAHEHAECQCNRAGRDCLHGCDLKKRSAPKANLVSPCHARAAKKNAKKVFATKGHDHSHDHGSHALKVRGQEKQAQWVSPKCSKQHQQKVLSFQGDPFLLDGLKLFSTAILIQEMQWKLTQPQETLLACDEHPPKGKDASDA